MVKATKVIWGRCFWVVNEANNDRSTGKFLTFHFICHESHTYGHNGTCMRSGSKIEGMISATILKVW